jgi:hypothetical protein
MAMISIARAQEHEAHEPSPPPVGNTWQWHFDASAFFGFNHQDRKFRDVSTWESQNWIMATGVRPFGDARVQLASMVSLEPFTLHRIGPARVTSPATSCRQIFATATVRRSRSTRFCATGYNQRLPCTGTDFSRSEHQRSFA